MDNDYSSFYLSRILQFIPQKDNEEWRPIRGAYNRYWISNLSRVCSVIGSYPKILHQFKNNCGYYRVGLSINYNEPKHYLVHRLVAEAFLENDDPIVKNTIHHKKTKEDNSADCLEPMSLKDNIAESVKMRRANSNGKE